MWFSTAQGVCCKFLVQTGITTTDVKITPLNLWAIKYALYIPIVNVVQKKVTMWVMTVSIWCPIIVVLQNTVSHFKERIYILCLNLTCQCFHLGTQEILGSSLRDHWPNRFGRSCPFKENHHNLKRLLRLFLCAACDINTSSMACVNACKYLHEC